MKDNADETNPIFVSSIKARFYFDKLISNNTYTSIPSGKLDVNRLLNGQKPFYDTVNKTQKDKKILVIVGFDIELWRKNKREIYRIRLKNLMEEGFVLFHYMHGVLKPFDLSCLNTTKQFLGQTTTPEPSRIVQQLNVPISELFIFDEQTSKTFVEGDDSDWAHLVGLEEVSLAFSPISSESLHRFLLISGQYITKLDLSNCINLGGADFDASIELPNLKNLIMDFTSTKNLCFINSYYVGLLIAKSPCLTHLDIKHVPVRPCLLDYILNPEQMLELILQGCRGQDTRLSLSKMNQLNRLEIKLDAMVYIPDISERIFPNLRYLSIQSKCILSSSEYLQSYSKKLSFLQSLHLNLDGSESDLSDVQYFFYLPKILKSLSLRYCQHLNRGENDNSNMPCLLEHLYLNHSTISLNALCHLLTDAPNLKTLDLSGCKQLNYVSEQQIESPNLEALESLNLSQSSIDIKALGILVAKAPKLVELDLGQCKNIQINFKDTKEHRVEHIDSSLLTIKRYHSDQSISSIKLLGLSYAQSSFKKKSIARKKTSFVPRSTKTIESPRRMDYTVTLEPIKKTFINENISVDLDTRWSDDTLQAAQIFTGKRGAPPLEEIRIQVFNVLLLNANARSVKDPIILSSDYTELQLQELPLLQRKKQSIYNAYRETDGDNYYFGRFQCDLNHEWQALPSLFPDEILQQFYVSAVADVEIKKSNENNLHYIRLKDIDSSIENNVTFEMLLFHKKPRVSFNDLPDDVRALAKNCRGYRAQALQNIPLNASATVYMEELIAQRVGSCEHRSMSFKYQMLEKHPEIPVRIIRNQIHTYVEILFKGQWLKCDLGGYNAKLVVNDRAIREDRYAPRPEYDIEIDRPAEEVYRQTFSRNGRIDWSDHLTRRSNLASVHFKNTADLVSTQDLSNIDTLRITLNTFSAAELHECLRCARNLKTLILEYCIIDDEQFRLLDFSMLHQLEHVTLVGYFIPDARSLSRLIKTTADTTKWLVETNDIDYFNTAYLKKRVEFKEIIRRRPEHRYFLARQQLSETHEMMSLLSADWSCGLINTKNSGGMRQALQKLCRHISKASYYIHDPDELSCNSAFIIRDGDRGYIHQGPGGPLYDFFHEGHDSSVLIINYNAFKPADIVRFNSLLDVPSRLIDGVSVPENCKIIGLMDVSSPDVYQGADFYSRFQYQRTFDSVYPTTKIAYLTDMAKYPIGALQIEIFDDWEACLLGFWIMDGTQLNFKKGRLLQGLDDQYQSFVFNHAPLNDPTFIRFLDDMNLHQGVFHQGRMLAPLPLGFNLSFTQTMNLLDKDQWLVFTNSQLLYPDTDCVVLNSACLGQFLGAYQYDDVSHGLCLQQGLIEKFKGNVLPVYVTATLTERHWYNLIEHCRVHKTILRITLAPMVQMPHALKPTHAVDFKILPASEHTQLILGRYSRHALPLDSSFPIVIYVSELQPDDLMQSLECTFNSVSRSFEFKPTDSFLLKALDAGEEVILTGLCSEALAESMHTLLFNRLQSNNARGRLRIFSQTPALFSLLPSIKSNPLIDTVKREINIAVEYSYRLDAVHHVLQKNPAVFITGMTGVGKTHFINNIWQKENPACHYGEEQILKWINDKSPGIKTLFIDEANISFKNWSEFNGLYQEPPAIFYQKQYHLLSKLHKVIFSGNPLSYGGERQQLTFFKEHPCQIYFKPLPLSAITSQLGLSDKELQVISAVVSYFLSLNSSEVLITPREIFMIVCLTCARLHYDSKTPAADIAQYFAYHLTKNYVPTHLLSEFNQKFKPEYVFPTNHIYLNNFVINHSNHDAVAGLTYHLDLREVRKSQPYCLPATGGLGGVVLEGEPGIGKSTLVKQILISRGLMERHDFIYIPVSLHFKDKERMLIDAFHQGMIVIIDEINSSPMLERLLNALLEGHDLDNHAAVKPGFMLVGTQNPITFHGRIKTTLPLMHRLQTIHIANYSRHEIRSIIEHIGVPRRIACDMIDEFERHQQKKVALCFRDLLKIAKKWKKNTHHHLAVEIHLNPIKQVGSLCKAVAISNVENYYARQLGYEPLPLWSMKIYPFSIRKLVKTNGSRQGEILEYDKWQKNFIDLGFDTETVDFDHDLNLFLNTIVAHLKDGDLPLIAFPVDTYLGLPDPEPENSHETEHAAIITGYNPKTDEVTLAHWGAIYAADLVTLFNSAHALPETRHQEFYNKNPAYSHQVKHKMPKYNVAHNNDEERLLHSIIPTEKSGFKTKLLIIKKPDKAILLQKREQLMQINAARYGFYAKPQLVLDEDILLTPSKPK